jgi:spermidine synthase
MARIAVRSRAEATSETSAFYGANTLGAACGALLAPFALLPAFGLPGALYAGAAIEAGAALLAVLFLKDSTEPTTERPADAAREPARRFHPLLLAAALLGFSSLALEIALLRLLVTVTGASVYAFGIVLFVFLAGIGIGARQLALRRTRTGAPESALEDRAKRARDALYLACLLAPLLVAGGLFALRLQLGEADLFVGLSNRVVQGGSILKAWLSHALFAGLALLPPAIAFGMALPAACGLLAAKHPEPERERWIARAYAWNTAGALLGSLGAALVLIPAFGPRGAVVAAVVVPFAAALLVDRARLGLLGLAAIATLGVASQSLFPAGEREAPRPLVLAHDAHTTASVHAAKTSRGEPILALRVNGKAEASTAPVDMRLQYLLGHVPGLLHGETRTALVIGLGTGMTGRVAARPAQARIARDRRDLAGRAQGRARVLGLERRRARRPAHARHDHGRTPPPRDRARALRLITSDPVHPWTRGSSDLYTLEHFRAMEAHLSDGGVASQWLPLYELSTEDVRTIVATWCAAFGHVTAWLTAYDLVLVGSRAPLPGEKSLATAALPPKMAARLAPLGIHDGATVAALRVAGDARLRAFARGVEPMRDARPVIEFRAPRSALSGYSTEVLAWAIEAGRRRRARAGIAAPGARSPRRAGALPRGAAARVHGRGRSSGDGVVRATPTTLTRTARDGCILPRFHDADRDHRGHGLHRPLPRPRPERGGPRPARARAARARVRARAAPRAAGADPQRRPDAAGVAGGIPGRHGAPDPRRQRARPPGRGLDARDEHPGHRGAPAGRPA